MITIHYIYHRKSDGRWSEAEKSFWDAEAARRFMWSLKRQGSEIAWYRCDCPSDNEYLGKTLYRISRSRRKA